VRHGSDADYELVVLEDCGADRDDELHRVWTTKVLARQAKVVSASELIDALHKV
jgi:hypothetical protein